MLQEDGVELTCGLTAAGELSVHGAGVGELVRVSSTGIGALSVYPVSGGSQYAWIRRTAPWGAFRCRRM